MPVYRINQFPEGSGSLSSDDVFLFMDDPSGSGITKKISLSEISNAIGGNGVSLVQNIVGSNNVEVMNSSGTFTIAVTGLQPSGNYSLTNHSHIISDVSGLQTALDNKQPSGTYASGIHSHISSDITDFNSSVSGLMPVKSIEGSGIISVSSSSGNYVISASGIGESEGNANTGDITFDGIKIIGSGTGSGDGNGYATMELVPDNNLYNNDQYLIVDPTGPNHIHLRAGGTIDDSNAEIILGGEKNNVRVNDQFPLARLQTESLITLNTYYLTSPEFSSVVWETVEGNHRVVINDPTSVVYDAVWAFTSDSIFSVVDGGGNYYELTRNGSSTPGGNSPIVIYVDQAPTTGPTALTQLTFEIRQNRQAYVEANGSDIRIEAADDVRIYSNDVFRLYNYSANDPIEIITDYDDSDHTWRFQSDGSLQFPDGSVQKYAAHIPTVVQLGSVSGTINTDASTGSIFDLTLTASGTLANPTNGSDGQSLRWRISYANSGIPLTLGNNFRIPSSASSPLPFSSSSGTMDMLGATYDTSRNKWDIIAFVPGY